MSGNGEVNRASENVLRPVSIKLLYEGMMVHDDIYDSTNDRLLVKAGNTLDADQIERMHRLNGGSETIYVTGRTQKTMASKRPGIDIASRAELEKSTGYAATLGRINILFNEITENKKVNRDGFYTVAGEISQFIKATPAASAVSLINAVTPVAEYLQRHILNVAILNGLVGGWLGLPADHIDKLVLVGLLHDCGHALMPKDVLYAPRIFTKMDFEVVKMHTVRTEQLLTAFPDDIRIAAAAHHERLDGSGYPKGISGAAVIGAARITAVSDIYESVVSTRSYRKPRSPFYVLAMFDDMSLAQIDNAVVGVFRENLPPMLTGKAVTMSDGTIGIIREYDSKDIKYPVVELSKREVKTNEKLHCVSMYLDD